MEDNHSDKVNETLQERPIVFDITVDKPNIWHKLGLLPKKRTYTIYPLPLRPLALLSQEVNKLVLKEKEFEKLVNGKASILDEVKSTMPFIEQNYQPLIRAIGIAILHKEPSKKFLRFIGNNIDPKELHEITSLLIQKFDLSFFLLSISYLKGVSVMPENRSTHGNSSEAQSEQVTAEAPS